MTIIKLGQIEALKLLPSGETLTLGSESRGRRNVRVEFNVSEEANLFLLKRDGEGFAEPQFLAYLSGFTVVEFVATGAVELQIASENGVQVWYWSPEADSSVMLDGETQTSFTKLHTPQARDHRFEMLKFQQEQSQRAFFAQMSAEFERRLAANPGVNPVTGELTDDKPATTPVGDDGGAPEPDADEGADESGGDAGEAEPDAK